MKSKSEDTKTKNLKGNNLIKISLLFFFVLFILISINSTFAETNVASLYTNWEFKGDMTNNNPYSVFVNVPTDVKYEIKELKKVQYFKTLDYEDYDDNGYEYDTLNVDIDPLSELNSRTGFWIPPYSKITFKFYGAGIDYLIVDYEEDEEDEEDEEEDEDEEDEDTVIQTTASKVIINITRGTDLGLDYEEDKMEIVGPMVLSNIKVIDLNEFIPAYKNNGISLDNVRLYVRGNIVNLAGGTVSLVMPAPIIINGYSSIDTYKAIDGPKAWMESYNDWVSRFKGLSSKNTQIDSYLLPIVDDYSLIDNSMDVPAFAYTTDSPEDVGFYYVVKWEPKSSGFEAEDLFI
ncbi:hypothetical protein [Methanococcus voltae]|uniref:Uncharacterized protein n=1 Tax=Methanococcus voltae (strain ATCC BAA-1334 / A3) TaxID=456320 RepID=D7DUR4_METV3|nr:hypothetical protein [Methanococcus voltae]MCS3900676.1 hypothetical protein [Methanococcus voltae]